MKKPEPDMSDAAVAARLEELRQLYRLGMSLREAGKPLRERLQVER